MSTFLQLAPEQGGTRFGPFPGGHLNLGTDRSKCQVVLAAMPGIGPVHAQLSDHGNGSFTVAPTQRGLNVYYAQAGQGQMWPVTGPVQCRSGDTIILGDPSTGPRFTLQYEATKRGKPGQPPGAGGGGAWARQGGFGNAMAHEVERQAMSRFFAYGPLRGFQNWFWMIRGGGLHNPRLIISLVVSIVGVLGMVFMSCAGLVSALIFGHH